MNELYWITRLDYFHILSNIFMIIGLIGILLLVVMYYVTNGQYIYDESREFTLDAKEFKGYRETCAKSLKYFVPLTVFFTLIYTLIPTTNEALVIYGIGGTIDYVKQNPTAKQLPDKCVKALDKWVDSWSEETDSIK